jgi:hypothetical protein
MWPPAVPEELDHGDHHCNPDAANRAEDCDACKAGHREPELPALDSIDAAQIGDLDEADGRSDELSSSPLLYGASGSAIPSPRPEARQQ